MCGNTREILETVSAETGVNWNESSMVEILAAYIDFQSDDATFEDFVRRRAQEENEEG